MQKLSQLTHGKYLLLAVLLTSCCCNDCCCLFNCVHCIGQYAQRERLEDSILETRDRVEKSCCAMERWRHQNIWMNPPRRWHSSWYKDGRSYFYFTQNTHMRQTEACVWLLVRVWSPPPRLLRLCPGAWREVSSNGDTAEKIYKAAAVRDTGLCNQDSQSTPNTCYLQRTCSSHPFHKLIFWANLSLIASTFLKSPII